MIDFNRISPNQNRLLNGFLLLLGLVLIISCGGPKEKVSVLPEEQKAGEEAWAVGAEVKTGTVVEPASESVQITFGDYSNGIGTYHPDGNRIAFQSNRTGLWQIYELNLVGGGDRNLFESNGNCENPVWLKDGSALLFVSDLEGRGNEWERDIFAYYPESKAVTRLTVVPADDWFPVALEEGSFIFLSERDADPELPVYYRQNSLYKGFLSGKDPELLAGKEFDPTAPMQLVKNRYMIRTSEGSLAILPAEGSELQPVTPEFLKCGSGAFIPNKNWLVFTARESDDYHLYILDLGTRVLQQLETRGSELRFPQISPDGGKILYTARFEGYFQLFELQLIP